MSGTPPTPIASNIITIAGHNVLTNYHSVTNAEVDIASIARTDDQAIQNSSTFFKCLESSNRKFIQNEDGINFLNC